MDTDFFLISPADMQLLGGQRLHSNAMRCNLANIILLHFPSNLLKCKVLPMQCDREPITCLHKGKQTAWKDRQQVSSLAILQEHQANASA